MKKASSITIQLTTFHLAAGMFTARPSSQLYYRLLAFSRILNISCTSRRFQLGPFFFYRVAHAVLHQPSNAPRLPAKVDFCPFLTQPRLNIFDSNFSLI